MIGLGGRHGGAHLVFVDMGAVHRRRRLRLGADRLRQRGNAAHQQSHGEKKNPQRTVLSRRECRMPDAKTASGRVASLWYRSEP